MKQPADEDQGGKACHGGKDIVNKARRNPSRDLTWFAHAVKYTKQSNPFAK